jgi:hypothetical protein
MNDESIKTALYNFSEGTKQISMLITISLMLTMAVFFTRASPFLSVLGKIFIILLLLATFIISFKNTTLIAESVNNLFLDPSVSLIRNNVLLSYTFSLATLVLLGYVIKSFFN